MSNVIQLFAVVQTEPDKKAKRKTNSYEKTRDRWIGVLKNHTCLTENEIIYLRKFLGSTSKISESDRRYIIDLINRKSFDIESNHSEKGIEWLRKTFFKTNGQRRNDKMSENIGSFEARIIQNFSHFQFVGVRNRAEVPSLYHFYAPIYRCFDTSGNWFDYASGQGYFEVLDIGTVETRQDA